MNDSAHLKVGGMPFLGATPRNLALRHAITDANSPHAAPPVEPPAPPSARTKERLERFVESYTKKSGTTTHPDKAVTEAVLLGLGSNLEALGRPLCPCRYYPDKAAEAEHRTWICACDDMQIYKYCHCMLFTNEEGLPITEHLPEGHEGRRTYGVVEDPHPEIGRPLRHLADNREIERRERKS
jgi:ferredoxin-thioredoxin reductase catalytic chain